MGYIDIHTHLPTLEEITEPRNLPYFKFRGPTANQPPIEALLSEMERGGIERAVVLGAPSYGGIHHDNDTLASALAPHPHRLIGFGSFDPHRSKDPAAEVRRCVESLGFRGIGEWGYFDYTDPICFPVYEACIDLGVPILIHTGAPLPMVPIRFGHPNLLDEVVIRYPELTVIAAHCGAPWIMDLAAVAYRHPKVWIDLSALLVYPTFFRYQTLLTMIAAGLADRLLFGSDFPVTSPADWARWLCRRYDMILLSKLFGGSPPKSFNLEQIMGGNARRLLKLG